jgi:hypothetical protein
MEKNTKRQLSYVCFIIGFALLLVQDLSGLRRINIGFSWPFDLMYYIGLILVAIGFALKG